MVGTGLFEFYSYFLKMFFKSFANVDLTFQIRFNDIFLANLIKL